MQPVVDAIIQIVRNENDERRRKEEEENIRKFFLCGRVMGSCSLSSPSPFVGYAQNDHTVIHQPYIPGKLTKQFIRNTNATAVYKQETGNCYAFAACSAYINTILRIHGSRPPPSFADCYKIADYNKGKGGNVETAIQLLENHFKYGVCCKRSKELSIRDAITISPIVSFTTSKKGWKNVSNGHLLQYPGGDKDGWHAALVEGYDFNQKSFICKNSWGDSKTAKPRFLFSQYAAHDYYFLHVYFTLESIQGKVLRPFNPVIESFTFKYDGRTLDCVWMDENTAIYTSDYVCQYVPERNGPCKYLGFDVYQFISIMMTPPFTYFDGVFQFGAKS